MAVLRLEPRCTYLQAQQDGSPVGESSLWAGRLGDPKVSCQRQDLQCDLVIL